MMMMMIMILMSTAIDLGVLVKAFIDDRNLLVRGLAHPALFVEQEPQDEVIITEEFAPFAPRNR
jgi:hypothetical protein